VKYGDLMTPGGQDWFDKFYAWLKSKEPQQGIACDRCGDREYFIIINDRWPDDREPIQGAYLCNKCYKLATGRDREKLFWAHVKRGI